MLAANTTTAVMSKEWDNINRGGGGWGGVGGCYISVVVLDVGAQKYYLFSAIKY